VVFGFCDTLRFLWTMISEVDASAGACRQGALGNFNANGRKDPQIRANGIRFRWASVGGKDFHANGEEWNAKGREGTPVVVTPGRHQAG
jgi:hypothetical protein